MGRVRTSDRFESLPVWTDKTRAPNMYQIRKLAKRRRAILRRDAEREALKEEHDG